MFTLNTSTDQSRLAKAKIKINVNSLLLMLTVSDRTDLITCSDQKQLFTPVTALLSAGYLISKT